MKKISWFSLNNTDISGERWFSQGYQNAAVHSIRALQEKGYGVFYNRREIPYHINFCPPPYYQLNSEINIGYTPWESTIIPDSWRYNMSQSSEIWATSEFVKNIYLKNQVHPSVHVIPHGISEEFSIYERELTGKFNFLHVGGDSKRKNAQMVVDAFLELYDGELDYQLILKYNSFCHADVYINGQIVPAHNHPQIIGIPESFTIDQLVRLYHKCHCMVYPTSGEGFGMIPFETIATGMPTICTNLTGCQDFAKMSIPLDAEWGDAEFHKYLYGSDVGDWAIPNYDSLVDLMTHVVNEYDEFKKYTLQSAKIIHSEMTWAKTADKMIERLRFFEESFN